MPVRSHHMLLLSMLLLGMRTMPCVPPGRIGKSSSDIVHELHPDETLTVILPEFVLAHWWEYPLHNQTAFRLKTALLARSGIVVTDIPQHLSGRPGRK